MSVPQYNADQKVGLSYVTRKENLIDVYIEDETAEIAYTRLVNRALDGLGSVSRVFALGGRSSVLAAARTYSRGRRPALFILDGDCDLLRGRSSPPLEHLQRLGVYCMENLLLEPGAIQSVIEDSSSGRAQDAEVDLHQLAALLDQTGDTLLCLFAWIALAIEHRYPAKTVDFDVFRLTADKRSGNPEWQLELRKIRRRCASIRDALLKTVAPDRLRQRAREIRSSVRASGRPTWHFISGKHYLMPLVRSYLDSLHDVSDELVQLCNRLSAHCDLHNDPALREAIRRTGLEALRAS